jgi:hypothetical protein
MEVSFFEEFPNTENLSKIKHIKWPGKLYLAAPRLDEFKKIKKKIKNENIKEIIYWPVLSEKEGYWISPFSKRNALLRIFEELWGKKVPLMLDLELPKKSNIGLYSKALFDFKHNKSLIKNFISHYKGPIYLAEYYPEGKWKEILLKIWGLHYDNPKVKIIKMMYHSMHNFSDKAIKRECSKGMEKHGKNFCIALGTIASGVNGNEPVLSGSQLKRDLKLVKESGIEESIIFRLGGLQESNVEFISEVVEDTKKKTTKKKKSSKKRKNTNKSSKTKSKKPIGEPELTLLGPESTQKEIKLAEENLFNFPTPSTESLSAKDFPLEDMSTIEILNINELKLSDKTKEDTSQI